MRSGILWHRDIIQRDLAARRQGLIMSSTAASLLGPTLVCHILTVVDDGVSALLG